MSTVSGVSQSRTMQMVSNAFVHQWMMFGIRSLLISWTRSSTSFADLSQTVGVLHKEARRPGRKHIQATPSRYRTPHGE